MDRARRADDSVGPAHRTIERGIVAWASTVAGFDSGVLDLLFGYGAVAAAGGSQMPQSHRRVRTGSMVTASRAGTREAAIAASITTAVVAA